MILERVVCETVQCEPVTCVNLKLKLCWRVSLCNGRFVKYVCDSGKLYFLVEVRRVSLQMCVPMCRVGGGDAFIPRS